MLIGLPRCNIFPDYLVINMKEHDHISLEENMSKKSLLIAIFLFISILGLSGCGPTLPPCDAGSLVPPELDDPVLWEILDPSSVVLNWHMDPACEPDQFEIILSQDRDYSVIEITHLVSGDNTSWSPPTLDSAEEYFWRVAAIKDSTKSSYSFMMKSFFTEPVCDPGDLVMPSLLLPPSGGIFDRGYSSLEWEWPLTTCIPEAYKVEVSMDPDFVDTTYFGGTGNPSTRWGFGSTPPGATQFWWRIIPSADEVYGPPSIVYSFFTDPICTAASLVAPIRLTPLDEEIVSIANPEFTWDYPDPSCAPEGFHLRISTTPDMSTLALDANNPNSAYRSFQAGYLLDDCQTYYYDVAVVSEGVEGPFSDVGEFSIDVSDACVLPACTDPLDIPQPILISPGIYEIVDTVLPILDWNNPGPCDPEGYAVRLSVDYDFSDSSLFGGTGSIATSWMPGVDLEPATQYYWKIAGGMGTTMAEFSSQRAFFTGPECSPLAAVPAPERYAPLDGTILDSLTAYLRYRPGEPGCIPDGYLLNLQTDPTFSGTNLLGEYGLPATTVITDPLTDCTTYYWKVTAVQDGGYSSESDVGWFSTNESGACPPVPAPGTARKNAFCREGTFPEHFPPIYTIEEGDIVQVIARNPFTTYLLIAIPGADGVTPLKPLQSCWTIFDAIKLWGTAQVPEGLEVLSPPPTPTPIYCHSNLNQENCEAAGGTYIAEKNYCDCP
jgi:hypothetical protein